MKELVKGFYEKLKHIYGLPDYVQTQVTLNLYNYLEEIDKIILINYILNSMDPKELERAPQMLKDYLAKITSGRDFEEFCQEPPCIDKTLEEERRLFEKQQKADNA